MRYAILSDIHGNGEALRAVLADIEQVSFERGIRVDQLWCLGDVVGYGPEPGECVRRIRARADICISGNHDWACVGKIDLADFSGAAAKSAEWTREHLSPDERRYLQYVPEVTRVGAFTLAHGSPSNPIWEYLITAQGAAPNFTCFDTLFCVVGHTHLPTIFVQPAHEVSGHAVRADDAMRRQVQLAMALPGGPSWSMLEQSRPDQPPDVSAQCERLLPEPGIWVLPEGYRAIINPGSVGQPRDGDPRASYLIYDSAVGFEFRRVAYNVAVTQQRIRESGLSPKLAERLARGV